MDRINPTTGRTLEPVEEHTAAEVEGTLNQASETFDEWNDFSVYKREQLINAHV